MDIFCRIPEVISRFRVSWPLWLVGIVVFPAPFASVQGEEKNKRSASVVVAGYNLKNYLRMNRRIKGEVVENAPKPEREIKAVLDLLLKVKPDILGLTEMGGEDDLVDLQKRLSEAGLDLPHRTLVDGADKNRHVALLSRFPIKSTDHKMNLDYPINGTRLPFRRGILDASIAVNEDYNIRLLGVHLKSKREVDEGDQALMRRNEAHLLRRHIDSLLRANPNENILVFGDFNENKHEAPIKAIRGSFGTDTYLYDIPVADEHGLHWTYHWSFADQYSRFDYLFVSKGLQPEVITRESYIASSPDWATASDHRPVVTTIRPVDR